MKKLIFAALSLILAGSFYGCEPIVEDGPEPAALQAEQFQANIAPVMVNGKRSNRVICETSSKVSVQWTDGIKTYTGNRAVMTLFLTGQQVITAVALNQDGSTFTKDFTVNVEEKSFAVEPQYEYLCGTGEKTWTWQGEKCFGNGGSGETGPAWWVLNPSDVTTQCRDKKLDADGLGATMTFTLRGLKMKKTSSDQKVRAGAFTMDLASNSANGWSYGIGSMRVSGTNILCGHDFNDAGLKAWSEYNIVSLTPDKMVLAAQEFDKDGWWYYVFVPSN